MKTPRAIFTSLNHVFDGYDGTEFCVYCHVTMTKMLPLYLAREADSPTLMFDWCTHCGHCVYLGYIESIGLSMWIGDDPRQRFISPNDYMFYAHWLMDDFDKSFQFLPPAEQHQEMRDWLLGIYKDDKDDPHVWIRKQVRIAKAAGMSLVGWYGENA